MSQRRELLDLVYNSVIVSLALLVLVHPLQATQGTFLCHKDLCTRGVHFCDEILRRCELCVHKKSDCDRSHLPRDCDGFCSNLKTIALLEKLNSSVTTNGRLQQENERLSATLQKSKKEKKTLETRLRNLKNLNLSLNSTLLSKNKVIAHLQSQLNKDKSQLQECSKSKAGPTIALATVTIGLVLIVTVIGICVCWRRRKCKIDYIRGPQTNDKEEKASLSVSDVESVSTNPESDYVPESEPTVPAAEEAGEPLQDARLTNVPPSSPDGFCMPVFN